MRTPVRATVASTCLALALPSHGAPPRATDPPGDRAIAEGLFDEGRKLLDEGKLEEACAKLEASNRIDPAVGTLLNLGDCNERRGRLASAWSNYRAAASLAHTRGDASRADFARKRSEAVRPRLSTLSVVVTAPEPGLRVTRDGVAVEDAALGTALPIDAGVHVIEAHAPGKKTWTTKITIAEGSPSSASVKIDPLGADTTPTPPEQSGPAPAGAGGGGTGTTVHTLGFVGVGLGAIALGSGVYFAVHAKSLWNDAGTHCNSSNRCDDYGYGLNRDARRNGDLATVTITAGLVLAAAGTLAILFAPRRPVSPSPAAAVSTAFRQRFTVLRDGLRIMFDLP